MASKYWIKLYHEILDDPKMGRLGDRLYRRTIEMFLLAGDFNEDGALPPIEDIAWRLRMRTEELETDLADLAAVSIVQSTRRGWVVTNFAERQQAVSDAERMRRYRDRKQQVLYYGNEGVTKDVTKRNVDKDIDKKKKKIKTVDLPEVLNTSEFVYAWDEWIAYRKEKRKSLTPRSVKMQLKKLTAAGPNIAVAMIEQSITNGWIGLFELKDNNRDPHRKPSTGIMLKGVNDQEVPY